MESNNQNTNSSELLNRNENFKDCTDIELQSHYQQLITNKHNYDGDKLFFYQLNLQKLEKELASRNININEIKKNTSEYKPIKYIENKDIVLSLKSFKKLSLEKFQKGGFEKLGHARESFAKELGFDCYRSYLKSFELYWNELSNNVSLIIKNHKQQNKPIPLIITIDTNWDYVDMLKDLFKKDFAYFETLNDSFSKEDLYRMGRKISDINMYDICTKQEYEYKYNNIVKDNSTLLHLNNCGKDNRILEMKQLLPIKIFESIERFEKNINEIRIEENVNYLTMVIQILMTASLHSLETLSEKEVLEILNDEEIGLPNKDLLQTLNINQMYERLSILGTKLLERTKTKQIIPINEAHNIMNIKMQTTPKYRELEKKGKKQKYI